MNIIIWGAGKFGKWAKLIFEQFNIIAFVDSDITLIGKEFEGYSVWSKEKLLKEYKDEIIIVTPRGYESEIGEWLNKNGIINWYAFEKELWGLHAFLKQVDLRKIQNELENNKWYIYPHTLLAEVISNYITSIGNRCYIEDELKRIEGRNVILTENLNNEDFFKVREISNELLDYTNLSLRDELFYYPELRKFKNICKKKRCFIVATGPSLRMEDLEKLYEHNEECFSMNGIINAFSETNWRPSYYCISDHMGLNMWLDEILSMNVDYKFVSDLGWDDEKFNNSSEFYKWHFKSEWIKGVKPKFNVDFTKGYWWARTVVCDICIPLAMYMGFKEIYLLGTDCTFDADPKKRHFIENYNKGRESKASRLEIDEIMLSYQAAKEYADAHDIKIMNATRGGSLEVFERVDFDSLFD